MTGIDLRPDGSFAGRASRFGIVDRQGDRVEAGAFAASLVRWRLRGAWPAMLWQHDAARPVGRWTHMAEDAEGLVVEGRLALDTAQGREAHVLLKFGAIDGLSIGYVPVRARRERAGGVRVLSELALVEISLVTIPANEASRVAWVKSAGACMERGVGRC